MNTLACVRCGVNFLVDNSKRCWWSQKFCDEECRKAHDSEKRCAKRKSLKVAEVLSGPTTITCEWCGEQTQVPGEKRDQRFCSRPATCMYEARKKPKPNHVLKKLKSGKTKYVLTDEQRQENELLRRQRSADSRRGQPVSQERRDKTSATLKRRYAAGEIVPVISGRDDEWRKRVSQGMIRAYREGRADLTGSYKNKWAMYEGLQGVIKMRSQSETLFAQHLDSIGVQWKYEPQRFDLGWSTYTPDFHLPESDHWVEVKGGWTEVSRRKFDEFSMTHSASVVLAKDILRGNFLAIGAAGSPSLFIGG